LPKRIVDLALIENDSTILCADKFGDVFGFPVIQPESDLSTSKTAKPIAPQSPSSPPPNVSKAELAGYTPDQVKRHYEKVANYTERERIAAERRKRTEIDYNLPFSHNFVLGHVSMLLSLITVTLPADHPQTAGKERTWILTSDRDEHIRVSRFPQSFVIDGFCLGHTSFVKAMITPSWESTILISGGGDEYLLVWNWREGNVVQKVDLMSTVQEVIGLQPSSPSKEVQEGEERDEDDGFKMAVSGMWELPDIRCILVGIESVPALFLFTYHSSIEGLRYSSTLPLQGKILDVAVDSRENTAYVSVDPSGADSPLLGVYRINNNGITWESIQPEFAKHVTGEVEKSVDLPADLVAAVRANVLYPVVGLRKDFGTFKAEEE
jgi:tRNA (guanine-N(7)-)-methyltransferase subunit TRM82